MGGEGGKWGLRVGDEGGRWGHTITILQYPCS